MSAQEQTMMAQIAEAVGLPDCGASPNVLTMVKSGQEAVDCLTSMGWEWTVDQGWNEVSDSTKIERNETFEDLRREEIAQLEAENHRLRDEFQKTLKTSARLEEVGKLREENKKLKEVTDGIMEEKGTEHILGCNAYEKFCQAMCELNYDEKFITELKEENSELKKNGGFVGDPETSECANAVAWRMKRDLIKKLQETVAEQATDLFFMKCENLAGGDHVRDDIGHGAEWAGEVKDCIGRLWHQCPVNDVDEKEMFKRYLEWSNIYLSDVESDEDE